MGQENDKTHVNLEHARQDHQRAVMEQIVKDDKCPFCRENFETYHTEEIVLETDHWILTWNFSPYEGTAQHFLLVAKQHCMLPEELSVEAWADLQRVLAFVRKEYDIPGSTFLMRSGNTDYTGATVTHLHGQLIVGGEKTKDSEPILTLIGYKVRD